MNSYLLRSKIAEHGETQKDLAKVIGITAANFSYKINGKVQFRQKEIEAIRNHYNLSADDVDRIFFAA